ncbi:glycosyltransferase family 4 protein [Paracoccus aminophilus]|uniref:Glycosyl transferase n=1 Tax=Paracoccus aminophilus JCM 7686 TaxID=1367847 RepID=S5Y2V9_PARAH|nr:glycosyltransferase family 1 protein [Paracoccus aminophilus]AGT10065.1 glycosyl transferase [Paracoccus aminophilus JCM 7686]
MPAEPGILLDISRLVSRLGGGPLTGIDRVELEWLRHLQGKPHLLLCRVPRGQALLPATAGALLLDWIEGAVADLPAPGLLDRLAGRTALKDRATRVLAAHALRIERGFIRKIAAQALHDLGAEAAYLNLGHANWRREVFAGLQGLRRVVMIHDTIPLDHPEFTRQGQSEKFRDRFAVAAGMADLVLTVSKASAAQIALWRGRLAVHGRAPIAVTPIGARPVPADSAALPPGLDLTRPMFIALGTIEPRKNHAVLLDAWALLAKRLPVADLPRLLIIGRRGWENHAVFARLDHLPAGAAVQEFGDLGDGEVAALMERAHALLMPSRAEGFGLPLIEAARLGLPVLASPLPSTRELLGDWARYLSPDEPEAWAEAVAAMAQTPIQRLAPREIPDWPSHFDQVQRALLDLRD